MGGGSGWILTGRYDPDSKTGDVRFQGHRCGAYAGSNGKYGFLSDDQYALQAPYLHMGIGVSDATKFEIEWVEVERSGFAGICLLNSRAANDPPKPMENVRVHDVYVHDTDGEGFYFGWTGQPQSNLLPGLEIYNTRILRTGNEALQIQDLGEGTHVHHNVFASGGLHSNALSLGPYIGGVSSAQGAIAFASNFFRGIVFGYDIISTQQPNTVFGLDGAFLGTLSLSNNRWEGARMLAPSSPRITMSGNTNGAVEELQFQDGGWPLVPGHHLTLPNVPSRITRTTS